MSRIEWTDETWNPMVGCSRTSTGCDHCYAERFAARGLQEAHKGLTVDGPKGPRWTGEVRQFPDRLEQPLRWRKPRRVFVGSMSDLFHESIPVTFIDRVFGIMMACGVLENRRHEFQVLTKRPERMAAYLSAEPLQLVKRWARWGNGYVAMDDEDLLFSEFVEAICSTYWSADGHAIAKLKSWRAPENVFPLRNVWLGTSCENQATLDARLPSLRDTPAAVRFLSLEPLLGQIYLPPTDGDITWVIVGGESGPGARPCWIDSIRTIITSCRAFRIPLFVKQLGARPYQIGESPEPDCNCREFACEHRSQIPVYDWLKLKSRKGGDPAEWPTDLRIREMPECPAWPECRP